MKRINLIIAFVFACIIAGKNADAQGTFFDIGTVQKIELWFSQSDYTYQLDTSYYGVQGYIMADSVKINGSKYDSVGVKYKGNSSFDTSHVKNPLHIKLNKYVSQNYNGVKNIKLANEYADPSMIREALSYNILAKYMDCPRSNFVQLYINGAYIGVYTNDEDIDSKFVQAHFHSSSNTFVKANPDLPSSSAKSDLKYISGDSTQYYTLYEMENTNGWSDFLSLCDTVTNYSSSLSNIMDIDRVIWMLAFDNVLVNLDSYEGEFSQNYFLYKDNTGHYNPIIWDMNMAFGGFPYSGYSNSSAGQLTVTQEEQMNPYLHATDIYWPLINDIMNNATYKRMYAAHMRTITNEMFASDSFVTAAVQMQSVIDTAVNSDTNKFYTYVQFQAGLTGDVNIGSYTVPGISNLMAARNTYLQSNLFNITPPVITNALTDTASGTVTIKAMVTNTNTDAVYAGYRFDTLQKFTRVMMYDDGAHGDGAAGDNVYGVQVSLPSTYMQYYIYAENDTAGAFAPARAEHEFYLINANVPQSVSNVATACSLKVYPNPATDNVHLSFSGVINSAILTNVTGQVVYKNDDLNSKEADINLKNYGAGIYFLNVNYTTQVKIIKQ